jgi:MFS family permease
MATLTQSALAAQALLLGALDLGGWINLPLIYALSLVLGVINAFDNPARRALVTELVEPALIPNATSLNTAVMTGSRIFGPALAAVLVGSIGTGWCFVLNGVTFGAIIVSLVAIRPAEMYPMPRRGPGGQPVREALRWVGSRQDMLTIFVVLVIVSTFTFNHTVSLPKLADKEWGGDEAFGLVLAVTSIGSLDSSRCRCAGTCGTSCCSAWPPSGWRSRPRCRWRSCGRSRSGSAAPGSSPPPTP